MLPTGALHIIAIALGFIAIDELRTENCEL
jgi:hypothetical protein